VSLWKWPQGTPNVKVEEMTYLIGSQHDGVIAITADSHAQ
jgi:hypothetical protein